MKDICRSVCLSQRRPVYLDGNLDATLMDVTSRDRCEAQAPPVAYHVHSSHSLLQS